MSGLERNEQRGRHARTARGGGWVGLRHQPITIPRLHAQHHAPPDDRLHLGPDQLEVPGQFTLQLRC